MMEQTIAQYKVIEKIGEGGMAIVYKALDPRLQRMVAIKVIRAMEDLDGRSLKRFEREAKALASLSHPNIVHILDYGEHEGRPFLVMDYLEGGSLMKVLGSPMPITAAVELVLPIARALEYAHKKGIVHRDIKPANIMLTASGDPMLTDFGIVKLLEKEESVKLTRVGAGIGTPEYMAPEQCFGGDVDQRADIYSLGIVLYELVTGRRPFTANTPMEVVIKQTVETPPSPRDILPEITPQLEKVILKALEKKPGERYPDMAAFADALVQFQAAVPYSVQNVTPQGQMPQAPHVGVEPKAGSLAASAAPGGLVEENSHVFENHPQSHAGKSDVGGEVFIPRTNNRRNLWIAVAAVGMIGLLCLLMICVVLVAVGIASNS